MNRLLKGKTVTAKKSRSKHQTAYDALTVGDIVFHNDKPLKVAVILDRQPGYKPLISCYPIRKGQPRLRSPVYVGNAWTMSGVANEASGVQV